MSAHEIAGQQVFHLADGLVDIHTAGAAVDAAVDIAGFYIKNFLRRYSVDLGMAALETQENRFRPGIAGGRQMDVHKLHCPFLLPPDKGGTVIFGNIDGIRVKKYGVFTGHSPGSGAYLSNMAMSVDNPAVGGLREFEETGGDRVIPVKALAGYTVNPYNSIWKIL